MGSGSYWVRLSLTSSKRLTKDWPYPASVIVSSPFEVCTSSTSWPGQRKKVFKTGLKQRLPQGVFWQVNSFLYFLLLFPFCSGFPSEIMTRNLSQPCANWCEVLSDRVITRAIHFQMSHIQQNIIFIPGVINRTCFNSVIGSGWKTARRTMVSYVCTHDLPSVCRLPPLAVWVLLLECHTTWEQVGDWVISSSCLGRLKIGHIFTISYGST